MSENSEAFSKYRHFLLWFFFYVHFKRKFTDVAFLFSKPSDVFE